MYVLERTKKWKVRWAIVAAVFFCLGVEGFVGGGYEIMEYGFMNEPFPSIVMVAAFFASVLSLGVFLTLHSLQKDLAEHFKSLRTN